MSNLADKIHTTPAVLKWARQRSGYTAQQAAELMRPAVSGKFLEACENGDDMMTYWQLETLAQDVYKRPPLLFFLSKPPKEEEAEKNFRTMPDADKESLSPQMRHMLRFGMYRKRHLRELYGQQNPADKKIFASLHAPQKQVNMSALALAARAYLGVSVEAQHRWKNVGEALQQWRNKITECGIFVFKERFDDKTYAGFCLHDETFPIIYVNSEMPKNRQIFTIFHELGHILLRTGGVDFRDFTATKEEQNCNRFAADFLLPDDDFEKSCGGKTDDKTIKKIARQYKVSNEVVLRKFVDKKLITADDYGKRLASLSAKPPKTNKSAKAQTQASRNNNRTNTDLKLSEEKIDCLGEGYIKLVLKKQQQEKISTEDAADYLGIKEYDLEDLEHEMELRQLA